MRSRHDLIIIIKRKKKKKKPADDEINLVANIVYFPAVFSTLSKTNQTNLETVNLSSSNAFNLVKFKILLFGKKLPCYLTEMKLTFRYKKAYIQLFQRHVLGKNMSVSKTLVPNPDCMARAV